MRIKEKFAVLLLLFTLPLLCMAATEAEKRAAIDNALSWLASTQQPDGHWENGDVYYDTASTGAVLLAFLQEKANWATDYSTHVSKGFEYLLNMAQPYNIPNQPHGNPDSDGNGIGVKFVLGGNHLRDTYVTGLVAPAFAKSGTPDALAANGPLASRTDGSGSGGAWTYRDVVVNVNDYFAFGQNESGNGRGGWRYYANYGSSDNSTAQWPALAGLFSEEMGVHAQGFVRDELAVWIEYIQNINGCSGYDSPTVIPNESKTGALLIEMFLAGDDTSSTPYDLSHPKVLAALNCLNTRWQNIANVWDGNFGHPYAMWAVYKGLEAMIGLDDTTHITNLHPQATARGGLPAPIDPGDTWNWWEDYTESLVNTQNANGSWNGYSSWTGPLATAWNISNLAGTSVPPPNPLNLTKSDRSDPVPSGENVTYDICFDNLSNTIAVNNVTLVDSLPAESLFVSASSGGTYSAGPPREVRWDIGNLAAGAAQQCVQLTLRVTAEGGTTITNNIVIDSDNAAPTPASEETEVSTPLDQVSIPYLLPVATCGLALLIVFGRRRRVV